MCLCFHGDCNAARFSTYQFISFKTMLSEASALLNEILHSLLKLEMFFETYQNKDTFCVKFQFA